MWPLLTNGIGDVVGTRDMHELVEVSARAHRDDRLMTDEHQRAQWFYVGETFPDCINLRLNLRDEPTSIVLTIDPRAHFFDTGFDLLHGVVADEQHRIAHRIQRADLAHVR